MPGELRKITLLCAEDDADYRLLTRRALKASRVANDVRFVEDGEELMDYLRRRNKYAQPGSAPRPGLILLDLNLPRKDGREALQEIKEDPELRRIPVVILTTSNAEEDVLRTYSLGASSYIRKPVNMTSLIDIMSTIGHYWFEIVELAPAMDDEESETGTVS
jgi:two-component system, response regulator